MDLNTALVAGLPWLLGGLLFGVLQLLDLLLGRLRHRPHQALVRNQLARWRRHLLPSQRRPKLPRSK